MKARKAEHDVELIGGLGSLTIEEEKALSTFFKKRKLLTKSVSRRRKMRPVKPSKSIV